jgi:hypothetical protein
MTDRFNQERTARQIITRYDADQETTRDRRPEQVELIEDIRRGIDVNLPLNAWHAGWGDLNWAVAKLELERRDG